MKNDSHTIQELIRIRDEALANLFALADQIDRTFNWITIAQFDALCVKECEIKVAVRSVEIDIAWHQDFIPGCTKFHILTEADTTQPVRMYAA